MMVLTCKTSLLSSKLETPPPVKLELCKVRVNGDTHSCRVHQANDELAALWREHLKDLMFVESEPSMEDDSFFFLFFL